MKQIVSDLLSLSPTEPIDSGIHHQISALIEEENVPRTVSRLSAYAERVVKDRTPKSFFYRELIRQLRKKEEAKPFSMKVTKSKSEHIKSNTQDPTLYLDRTSDDKPYVKRLHEALPIPCEMSSYSNSYYDNDSSVPMVETQHSMRFLPHTSDEKPSKEGLEEVLPDLFETLSNFMSSIPSEDPILTENIFSVSRFDTQDNSPNLDSASAFQSSLSSIKETPADISDKLTLDKASAVIHPVKLQQNFSTSRPVSRKKARKTRRGAPHLKQSDRSSFSVNSVNRQSAPATFSHQQLTAIYTSRISSNSNDHDDAVMHTLAQVKRQTKDKCLSSKDIDIFIGKLNALKINIFTAGVMALVPMIALIGIIRSDTYSENTQFLAFITLSILIVCNRDSIRSYPSNISRGISIASMAHEVQTLSQQHKGAIKNEMLFNIIEQYSIKVQESIIFYRESEFPNITH